MSKFSNAILDLYECAQAALPDQFSEQGLLITKEWLNFNSAAVAGFRLTSNKEISIDTLHLHNASVEKIRDRSRITGTESLNDDSAIQSTDSILVQAFQNQGSCIAADTSLVFNRRRHAAHLAYCKKYETAHSLVLLNHQKNKEVNVVALWRAQPKNRYAKQELNIGNQLLPHLLQAYEINKRIAAGNILETRNDNISLIASENGILYFSEASAISLMQSEWKEWTPPLLPAAMMEAFRSGNLLRFQGKNITATATLQDRLLCIKLEKRLKMQDLTQAEQRVAQMASQGLSNKEIAKILGNAPATVRNQLHSVYQKLNVANKTSLAKFLPHRLPS